MLKYCWLCGRLAFQRYQIGFSAHFYLCNTHAFMRQRTEEKLRKWEAKWAAKGAPGE